MNKIYAVLGSFLPQYVKLEENIYEAQQNPETYASIKASCDDCDDMDGGGRKPYKVISGIALYAIDGPMIPKGSWFSKWLGIADYETISNALAMMAHDPQVENILIAMNTPGGAVSGISDVAYNWKRANAKKPITTHTSGNIASAGLWLASHSKKIYASPSGNVGSLGAKLEHMSYQGKLEEEGMKHTEVKSAKYKAIGSPYKDLSDEELIILQAEIDEAGQLFKNTVYSNRPQVNPEVESGLMYSASRAFDLGLIDGIKTYGETFETLSADRQTQNNQNGVVMKIKMTESQASAAIAGGADPSTIEIISEETYAELVASGEITEISAEEVVDPADSEETPEPKPEEELDFKAKVAELTAELEEKGVKISELASNVEALNAKNLELEAKSADYESLEALKSIACEIVNNQRVALQLPKVDMEDLSAKEIVEIHANSNKMFKKNFKVGGHTVKNTEEPSSKPVAKGSVASARVSAVGI